MKLFSIFLNHTQKSNLSDTRHFWFCLKLIIWTFRYYTAQKMKFSIKDIFNKCNQENFIFCAVLLQDIFWTSYVRLIWALFWRGKV